MDTKYKQRLEREKQRKNQMRKYYQEHKDEIEKTYPTKICYKCGNELSRDMFYLNTANIDGLSSWCKQCQHDYDVQRRGKYVPNYLMHKDDKKFCSSCKQWVDEKDFYKSKSSKDGLSSRCKFCQQAYDKEHKEQINKRQKQYKRKQAENVMFRLNDSISSGIYNSLKENKANRHWEDLVGYSLQELKEHLESQFRLEMNWNNYGSYWEIDHIIPKSQLKFESIEDKDFKICWSLANLRPLAKIENRRRPKDGSDVSDVMKQKILSYVEEDDIEEDNIEEEDD